MSAPGTPISALWFDHKGCGPSELALQIFPIDSAMDGAIPASLMLRVKAETDPNGDAIIYETAGPLIDSGFGLEREQVEELHRQTGGWLAATATSLASSASDDEQPHVVNLTALAEARAKMTPGKWDMAIGAYCAPELHEACGIAGPSTEGPGYAWVFQSDAHDECSHPILRADAAGISAEHNAMPVLIEVARAALEWQTSPQVPSRAARQRLIAALAKVAP